MLKRTIFERRFQIELRKIPTTKNIYHYRFVIIKSIFSNIKNIALFILII